jgi:hypothetical protein
VTTCFHDCALPFGHPNVAILSIASMHASMQ